MLTPGSLGARMLDMGAALLLTGLCPSCGLRIPCLNTGATARHRYPGVGDRRGRRNFARPCRGSGRSAYELHIDQIIPEANRQ